MQVFAREGFSLQDLATWTFSDLRTVFDGKVISASSLMTLLRCAQDGEARTHASMMHITQLSNNHVVYHRRTSFKSWQTEHETEFLYLALFLTWPSLSPSLQPHVEFCLYNIHLPPATTAYIISS